MAETAGSETDVLGAPYVRETIELPDDDEGAVVATLVSKPAETRKRKGAVLHVHGFCDYFFQTAEADFFTSLGYDFYALEAAMHRVRERDGHERVVISGHSTGGLVTTLWAGRRREQGLPAAEAFVLNSPWLDLQGPFLFRTAGTEAINQLGQRRPYAVIPRPVSGVYAETLHRDFRGEWDFDLTWKPRESFPARAGWLRAIRAGHRTVHQGIDVGAPVLTLTSTRHLVPKEWTEECARTDTVLDVRQIAKWSHQLGRQVTVIRVEDAIHDVFLSRKEVRQVAFEHVDRWLAYALP